MRLDLHMYEGRTDVEEGKVLGHENLGEAIEVGKAVESCKFRDMVCLPFNISCGHCKNCERGLTGFCLVANPGNAGAAYGYAGMGPYSGGQAELLRVPYGDFNCLKLPEDAKEKEADYVMLSDIFPTGWHATELGWLKAGRNHCDLRLWPGRAHGSALGHAQRRESGLCGRSPSPTVCDSPNKSRTIPIDDSKNSPVEQVLSLTEREGADRGCKCVGYQCHDPAGHEVPNMTMNNLVQSVRPTGGIGVVGVFVSEDPKGADKLAKEGKIAFDLGAFFEKGQHMATGQANVKAYNRYLRDLIHQGRAKPSWIISHELTLDEAPDAYSHFDAREKGWTKVVLHPGMRSRRGTTRQAEERAPRSQRRHFRSGAARR